MAPEQAGRTVETRAGFEAKAGVKTGAEPGAGHNMGMMRASSDAELNTARISMRDLSFFYGATQALKSIALDLPAKQVTGMIGRAAAASPRCCGC